MTEGPEMPTSRQIPNAAPYPGSEAGHMLGQEQRALIEETIRGMVEAWRIHYLSVPAGTEPDFVFRPTPVLSQEQRDARGGGIS